MKRVNRRAKRGFSLIELLVVIAIIAILAAILFPIYTGAKENSKRAKCLSNLKQIGTSIIMYLGDHDDYYPIWEYDGTNSWATRIMKYAKNEAIFHCPSDTSTPQKNWPDYMNTLYGNNYTVSYFYNRYLSKAYNPFTSPGSGGYNPVKTSDIKHATKLIMIFEVGYDGYSKPFIWADGDVRAFYYAGKFEKRHKNFGFNFMCADGSARWLPVKPKTPYNTFTYNAYTVLPGWTNAPTAP